MDWTTTQPTHPGFYFWRYTRDARPKLVEVMSMWGKLKLFNTDMDPPMSLERICGEWYGPIEPPK